MDIGKEKIKQEFWNWAKVENPRVVENAELGDVYATQILDHMFMGFAAAKAQAVPECKWSKNQDGFYDTSCTNAFVFPEPEDTPKDHDFTHCPFCGGKLSEPQEPT